jgi:multimeric flavodoxin WrbA
MKVIALNCSPRKSFNTAEMLNSALDGAKSKGAETKLVNLYDFTFQGCKGCLACKLIKNEKNVLCVVKDDITELLKEMSEADALIFGSPIYFGDVTSQTRAIIERFAYPYFQYSKVNNSKAVGITKTAFIYTMNINEEGMEERNYAHVFDTIKSYFERIFGHSEYITACNTMPVKDFSKYIHDYFDVEAKERAKEEQFPKDIQHAYELGASIV